MLRGLFLTMTAALIGLGTYPPAVGQEAAPALLVGTWEGKVKYGESAPAMLQFSDTAGALKWSYSFKYDPVLWGDAEGTVTSLRPPTLQLAGAWTKHAVPGAVGTPIKFTLTVAGDQMKGTVIAEMNNMPVEISLTRKK